MDLIDRAGLSADRLEKVRRAVAGQTTLGDVLDWGRGRHPPVTSPAVITQDEYTHDVILPFDDGLYLVYDTT